jgi:hypothetical protein
LPGELRWKGEAEGVEHFVLFLLLEAGSFEVFLLKISDCLRSVVVLLLVMCIYIYVYMLDMRC